MLERLLVVACLCGVTQAAAQAIYTWDDADGPHYTNDPSTIPPGARRRESKGDDVSVLRHGKAPAPRATGSAAPEAQPESGLKSQAAGGPVKVELTEVKVPLEEVDRQFIVKAVENAAASPQLAAWGGLSHSARVEVVSSSELAECAFGQAFGLDLVKLRSPKEVPHGALAMPYEDTMVHELAHLLENQRAGQSRPRWFAEGFANVVEGSSGYASAADVAWWTIARGGERPLSTAFSNAPAHVAYAIATAGVNQLVDQVGRDGILKMFKLRAQGASFEAAFRQVAGVSVREFEARFAERQRPLYHERAESPQ